MQVLEIQLAVKAKVKSFVFEGSELPLRPTCNVFITMNPGYAGACGPPPSTLKAQGSWQPPPQPGRGSWPVLVLLGRRLQALTLSPNPKP